MSNPMMVEIVHVHQVLDVKSKAMVTYLVLDVFGHEVEVPVTDGAIMRVVQAAMLGEHAVEPVSPEEVFDEGPGEPPPMRAQVPRPRPAAPRVPTPSVEPEDEEFVDDDPFAPG